MEGRALADEDQRPALEILETFGDVTPPVAKKRGEEGIGRKYRPINRQNGEGGGVKKIDFFFLLWHNGERTHQWTGEIATRSYSASRRAAAGRGERGRSSGNPVNPREHQSHQKRHLD